LRRTLTEYNQRAAIDRLTAGGRNDCHGTPSLNVRISLLRRNVRRAGRRDGPAAERHARTAGAARADEYREASAEQADVTTTGYAANHETAAPNRETAAPNPPPNRESMATESSAERPSADRRLAAAAVGESAASAVGA
jgi:hypothetical protein